MESKRKFVHHIFESIYDKYDFINNLISLGLHKKWRRDAINRLGDISNCSIVDLCCGTGDFTIALAKKAGNNSLITGIDFSENMLTIAKEKASRENVKNIKFVHCNVLTMPFESNTFDIATICFGLRNIVDYKQALIEINRLLKPNGKFACMDMSHPTIPGYRKLCYGFVKYGVPFIGKLWANKPNEYAWLFESMQNFPDKFQLADEIFAQGFTYPKIKTYAGGIVALHVCTKTMN